MIYLGGSIGSGEVFITMARGSVQMRCGSGGIKKRSRPAFMEPLPSFNSSSSSSSSFPLKDDAGYIGYLTDDESDSGSGSGGGRNDVVERRRRELLRTDDDISFSGCLLMIITACGLLMLAVWCGGGSAPQRR
jgi:hypothetical protein